MKYNTHTALIFYSPEEKRMYLVEESEQQLFFTEMQKKQYHVVFFRGVNFQVAGTDDVHHALEVFKESELPDTTVVFNPIPEVSEYEHRIFDNTESNKPIYDKLVQQGIHVKEPRIEDNFFIKIPPSLK